MEIAVDNFDFMTNEELEELIKTRLHDAASSGTLSKLHFIAVQLGERDELIFDWTHENIRIRTDEEGDFLYVKVDGKEVVRCSEHKWEDFFIPGAWLDKVLPFHDAAVAKDEASFADNRNQRRLVLLSRLR